MMLSAQNYNIKLFSFVSQLFLILLMLQHHLKEMNQQYILLRTMIMKVGLKSSLKDN